MSWNFLISFAIGVGVYLAVVGVFAFIKRHKNKKLAEKDRKDFENEDK